MERKKAFLVMARRPGGWPGGNSLGTLPGGSANGPYFLKRDVDATAVNAILTPNPTTVAKNLRHLR